jgi:hypothetical protein
MLGGLGASTPYLFKDHDLLLFFFEHQTNHAACFNDRGLLYESIFDALLFFSSYRAIGKPCSHQVDTSPSFYFLDHQTHHAACLDAWILLYECILDAL